VVIILPGHAYDVRVLSRLQHWRSTRQRARITAVQAVSDLYYREGFVPRGTFRRLRRAELRRLRQREGPGPLATAAHRARVNTIRSASDCRLRPAGALPASTYAAAGRR
jgi:hypothetical protein